MAPLSRKFINHSLRTYVEGRPSLPPDLGTTMSTSFNDDHQDGIDPVNLPLSKSWLQQFLRTTLSSCSFFSTSVYRFPFSEPA